MFRTLAHSSIAASLLLAIACSSAEDRAAKARIFSPEDPPKVLLAAGEGLDPSKAAKDADVLDRILSISGAEAQARIGPHIQSTTVEFGWTSEGNETSPSKEVRLTEDRYVALGAAGDFHVRIENDERQGMEWIKLDGISYARSRYARFRERRRDRGSSEHVLASAYETLETFHDLVHGAMRLEPAGTESVSGRRVVKYNVSLGEPRKAKAAKGLPPVELPKDGPDSDTALRLAALAEGRPSAVSGTLSLDGLTGVPLSADLRATIFVPAKEAERKAAHLELSVRLLVSGIGKDPGIAIPEHIEDAPRPPGVVATLRAYGLEKEKEKEASEAPIEPADEE